MSDLSLKSEAYTSVPQACSFERLMSDLCLKNEAYTVCSEIVPSPGSCKTFALLANK